MDRKKEIKDELEEISPFLASLPKEEGFQVPVNYFDTLADQVLEEVQPQAEPSASPSVSWLDRLSQTLALLFQPRYATGLAALALLIVAGVFFLRPSTENQTLAVENGEISAEDVFFEDLLDEFDAEALYNELATMEQESTEQENEWIELDPYLDDILEEMDDTELEEFL